MTHALGSFVTTEIDKELRFVQFDIILIRNILSNVPKKQKHILYNIYIY